MLQKKAVRIMTFSKFDEHSSPLFKKLNIIKLSDLIKYHISIFMFKFHNQLLPSVFNSYFTSVENIHSYNTRATAKKCYYLPKARTNYGLFSVRYQGPKIWNMIEQQIKLSSSIHQFKQKLKIEFFSTYWYFPRYFFFLYSLHSNFLLVKVWRAFKSSITIR